KNVLPGGGIGDELILQLRRQVDEGAGDAQAGRAGDQADLLHAIGKGAHVKAKAIDQIQVRIGRQHHSPDDVGKPVLGARAQRQEKVWLGAVALADQQPIAAAILIVKPELGSVIDPLARVENIVSGQAIATEQIGIVEIERKAVLVRDVATVAAR